MRRALALLVVLVAAATTGCGGADESAPARSPAPAATQSAQEKAQEAARKLLKEFEECGSCTGAERARERVENGLASKPDG